MNRTPEYNSASTESPIEKQAREFCDALRLAISIAADFHCDPSEENWKRLEGAQKYMAELSPRPRWGDTSPFRLIITPGLNISSHISKDMVVRENNPGHTTVDEVIAIREDEVVFFSQDDETYLVIFGHDMEIKPVFPDESSDRSPEAEAQ